MNNQTDNTENKIVAFPLDADWLAMDWWTRVQAATYLSVSPDTIDRHRVLWSEKAPERGKYRYKMCQIGGKRWPRVWAEDVKACLFVPGERTRPPDRPTA